MRYFGGEWDRNWIQVIGEDTQNANRASFVRMISRMVSNVVRVKR